MQQPEYRLASRHLRRLAKTVDDFVTGGWSADSPAALGCANEPFAGLWRSRPQQDASLMPMQLLCHTTDHLRALAAALDEPDVVMSMLSLVRPALESLGTAHYLLDERAEPRERLRRAINVDLAAQVEGLRMLPQDDDKSWHPDWLNRRNSIYWIGQKAPQHGFILHRAKRGPGPGLEADAWLGDKPPHAMALAELLFDDVEGGSQLAGTMHRLTSAVVHGQMHGLSLFLRKETACPLANGMAQVRFGLDLRSFAIWSVPLMYGLHRAVSRACDDYGWDAARWQRLSLPALTQWAQWMRMT